MFRRKKDDRPDPHAATTERALGERAPGDRAGGERLAASPDRPPPMPDRSPAADNLEMARMIANRPAAPAVPSLQSPSSHPAASLQPAQAGLPAAPPQPPSMPPASPPKSMVPFVAPAPPGFAVRPPQPVHQPQREPRAEPASAPADGGKRLLVGRDIYLSGQITSCDRLLVEGRVEATLSDSSMIEIAESGIFKGRAEIDDAEIAGRFEGDITVRRRLFIRATGRLRGKIRYGQIEIEPGGEIAGEVEVMSKAPARDFAGDGDAIDGGTANGHDEGGGILGRGYAEPEAKLV